MDEWLPCLSMKLNLLLIGRSASPESLSVIEIWTQFRDWEEGLRDLGGSFVGQGHFWGIILHYVLRSSIMMKMFLSGSSPYIKANCISPTGILMRVLSNPAWKSVVCIWQVESWSQSGCGSVTAGSSHSSFHSHLHCHQKCRHRFRNRDGNVSKGKQLKCESVWYACENRSWNLVRNSEWSSQWYYGMTYACITSCIWVCLSQVHQQINKFSSH